MSDLSDSAAKHSTPRISDNVHAHDAPDETQIEGLVSDNAGRFAGRAHSRSREMQLIAAGALSALILVMVGLACGYLLFAGGVRANGAPQGQAPVSAFGGKGGTDPGGPPPGDDYPSFLKDSPQDSKVDMFGEESRECVSYVAMALYQYYGYALPWYGGNASDWKADAEAHGVKVDDNPTVNSVAWQDGAADHGLGHVALVVGVGNGVVTVEQYNFLGDGTYTWGVMATAAFQAFIHFVPAPATTAPAPRENAPTPTQSASNAGEILQPANGIFQGKPIPVQGPSGRGGSSGPAPQPRSTPPVTPTSPPSTPTPQPTPEPTPLPPSVTLGVGSPGGCGNCYGFDVVLQNFPTGNLPYACWDNSGPGGSLTDFWSGTVTVSFPDQSSWPAPFCWDNAPFSGYIVIDGARSNSVAF